MYYNQSDAYQHPYFYDKNHRNSGFLTETQDDYMDYYDSYQLHNRTYLNDLKPISIYTIYYVDYNEPQSYSAKMLQPP